MNNEEMKKVFSLKDSAGREFGILELGNDQYEAVIWGRLPSDGAHHAILHKTELDALVVWIRGLE
jgi:hypothetical protein